jgi:hypothetical protein
MKYRLFSFSPDTVLVDGYRLVSEFDTEQECNQAAFDLGLLWYRIELQHDFGCSVVWESEAFD